MMNLRFLTCSVLAFSASAALTTPGQDLKFGPKAGAIQTKSFRTSAELELEEMEMSGVPGMDASAMEMEMSVSSSSVVEFTDTFVEMGDGQPKKLQRRFDKLSNETKNNSSNKFTGAQEATLKGSSELEGQSVVFTHSGDGYDIAFAEGSEGEEQLLADLREDTDLREFLPGKEVNVGDSWTVAGNALRALIVPGGDTKITMEGDSPMGSDQMPGMDKMIGEMEGDVRVTYKANRDEDGMQLAVLKLEFDVRSANDLTALLADAMGENAPPGAEMEISAFDTELSLKGTGELSWNVAAGVLHSATLKAEISMALDTAMSISAGGQNMDVEQSMSFSGEETLEVTTTLR